MHVCMYVYFYVNMLISNRIGEKFSVGFLQHISVTRSGSIGELWQHG